jgi:hypothetical protein
MKTIDLGALKLSLSESNHNVTVDSELGGMLLSDQTMEAVSGIIKENFAIVKSHYNAMIATQVRHKFQESDIDHVSVLILLDRLYIYNSWRKMYKKQENINLRFRVGDFEHPETHDLIFSYFKEKYPQDWEEKCAVLVGMTLGDLRAYYTHRELDYNK